MKEIITGLENKTEELDNLIKDDIFFKLLNGIQRNSRTSQKDSFKNYGQRRRTIPGYKRIKTISFKIMKRKFE